MHVFDERFQAESGSYCTNYPNLFCYKNLFVSGFFSAHHQEFSTVNSALVSFMQVSDDRFKAESGSYCTNYPNLFCYKNLHFSGIFSAHHQEFSTVNSVLVSFMQVFDDRSHEKNQCRMYSRELLMMGRGDARNMYSFITE